MRQVVAALTALKIDYMLTGSLASSAQGEPRSTHDIDLVVAMPLELVRPLAAAFPPPDFYLSEDAIRDAIRHRSMFNLLSLKDGEKVDFWILTDEPFNQTHFARKRVEPILGMPLNVSSPEDTMLSKLRWARLSGGSEKQFTDVLRVYEIQGAHLDLAYLNYWAEQLGVTDLWQQIQERAKLASE